MLEHAASFPLNPVFGVLLSSGDSIDRALPLFHSFAAPVLLESALQQIDALALKHEMKVSGCYFAAQSNIRSCDCGEFPSVITSTTDWQYFVKLGNKLVELYQHSVLVALDNNRLDDPQRCAHVCIPSSSFSFVI